MLTVQKLLKDIGADLPSIIQSDPFTLSSSALILFSKPCPSNPSHRKVLQNAFPGSVSAGSTLKAAVLKAQGHGRHPGKGAGIPCFPGRTHSLSPGLHCHPSRLKLGGWDVFVKSAQKSQEKRYPRVRAWLWVMLLSVLGHL